MPRKLAPDLWLFGTAVVLLSTGVVMVYSASAIVAADRFHDPYFFVKKQIFWALLGAACLWAALRLDYRRLEGFVVPLLIFVGVLLVLVLVSPIGQAINGTRRWIRLGPISFQPAELAKLALVIYLSVLREEGRGDRRLPARARPPAGGGRSPGPPRAGAAGPRQLPHLDHAHVHVAVPGRRPGAPPRLHPAGRGAAAGGGDLDGAVPAAPHRRVHRPVVRSAGQRIPDHPVVARVRQRRDLRPGHRRLAPEALLPAGVAHRLHLRDR